MKKICLLISVICVSVAGSGQVPPAFINPYPKTVSVSGTAEMEIVPDEIFVNIQLQEYQKKGESKKDLELIKSGFLKACAAAGIPDSLVSIFSYSGAADYYASRKKKKDPNLFAAITYQVKFNNSRQMDELIQRLDDEATKSFQINNFSHSRIIEIKRQLKIKAIQAAKEKGIYLAEAIGEKLGEAVTISEPGEYFQPFENAQFRSTNGFIDQGSDNSQVDFRKLKLKFTVSVVFALK